MSLHPQNHSKLLLEPALWIEERWDGSGWVGWVGREAMKGAIRELGGKLLGLD